MNFEHVFVTVGTTQFDKLINSIVHDDVIEVLKAKGCKTLTLQVGQGTLLPDSEVKGIKINSFSLKPSILDDISNSDLVISHAGAGSCLDVLGAKKPLLVVVNEDLMDNHQEELASKLEEEGYLYKCNCKTLVDVLKRFNKKTLRPYEPGNPKTFSTYIDCVMGFSN